MAEPASVEPPRSITVRRFEVPDLDRHGSWLLPRLTKAMPHINERFIAGWLRGLINSNEFLFLFSDHAVALFQSASMSVIQPESIVGELFVWCEDKDDKMHVDEAAALYGRALSWARGLGANVMLVEERTDVPHERIKAVLGRLFERRQIFARL